MIRIDETSAYRRRIIPWYDGEGFCLGTILFLFPVFLFALEGLSVAREVERFKDHIWVPAFLLAMSGTVMVSVTGRLVLRYLRR